MGTIHQVNRKRAADYVTHPRVYIRDTCPINMKKRCSICRHYGHNMTTCPKTGTIGGDHYKKPVKGVKK